MLRTSCHCATVRVEIARRPKSLTECNCSICRRYGARWAYSARKSITLTAPAKALVSYARGSALFFDHCRRCGCAMLYRPIKSVGDRDRLGINMRMIDDPSALVGIRIQWFDSAKSWKDVATCTLTQPWW